MNPTTNPDVTRARAACRFLAAMLRELGVRRMCLHGSRAKQVATPDSDWDFMVELSHPLPTQSVGRMRETLERLLHGPVEFHVPGRCPDFVIENIRPHCIEVFPA